MKKPAPLLLAVAAAALLVGCATVATSFSGVSSLRGADVAAADTAPETAKVYAGKRPGTQPRIARTYDGQPPLIPHAIENFDEITVEENQCLECHAPGNASKKNAPQVADSHLIGRAAALRQDRYQCNSCHVPQVDAKPLVDNRFAGHLKTPQP